MICGWVLIAALVNLAAAVSAQTTGSVSGVIRDSVTNARVPSANARLSGGGITFVATADADGRYRIDAVPEGNYKLDGYTAGYVGPSATRDLQIRFTSGSF